MKWKETWELPSIPDPVFWPEVGRRRGQSGGKPKTLRSCEFCREEFGARDMQFHLPRCIKRPNSRKIHDKGKTNMATSVVRSLPSNIILPTIPTTRDARAAHTGLVIFDCFEKIIELNKALAGKPRGKRTTNQVMKLLATATIGKEQLLDYLKHTVKMKAIGDQEEADILARRAARN